MMSLRGQASWAKMTTSLRGKLTALVCHLTKFVNKAEYRNFLSINIEEANIGYLFVFFLCLFLEPIPEKME
jgi:hypothetical protein